jgi:putative membrane protein
MSEPRRPAAFDIDEREGEPRADPQPGRKPRAFTGIEFESNEAVAEMEAIPPALLPSPRHIRWFTIFASTLAALVLLWAGLAVTQLIEEFFARSEILGWIVAAIAGVTGFSALAILLGDLWGLFRLRRMQDIQADAAYAITFDDSAKAVKVVANLTALYSGRHDSRLGLAQLREHSHDIMDPRDRVRLAERLLIDPLDAEAHRIIARAARRITVLTTLMPAAALDMLFVAVQNLRMARELATLYGGRPSNLGTLTLARMVVSHLAVTGGLDMSDSLLQHVVGRGLVGRLSTRFGEGAVNGILTCRVGLAAVEVCRPVPQKASAKETLSSLLRELVTLTEVAPKEPKLDSA